MPFLQVVAYLVPMFLLSWQLTMCLLAVNSVMMAIELLLLNPMHRISRELSGINTAMTNRLSDMLQGMEQVRMFSGGRGTVAKFREENHRYEKKYGRKTLYTACLEGSSKGFELLCSLVFLMLGVYYVDKGYTTLGALAAIYTMYASFSFQFYRSESTFRSWWDVSPTLRIFLISSMRSRSRQTGIGRTATNG